MRRVVLFLLNNILVNQFLILIRCDGFIKRFINNWSVLKINPQKTLQENVGFSHNKMIDEAIQKVQNYVTETEKTYVTPNGKVMDIGCGVGLYIKKLKSPYKTGIDLNRSFLNQCKTLVPDAITYCGDYLNLELEKSSFDYIYSVSVIEYVPPSRISDFFKKINSELKPGGVMLIQYPHALNYSDRYYPDLSYISYMPSKLESIVKENFDILLHEHSFDGRKVSRIDKKNYSPDGSRFFCNGMVLIARKRAA
jgi:cyclopropane fatty-acyl-phospholipid synthase-like methyltransferase